MRRAFFVAVLLCVLAALPICAQAGEARDITADCAIKTPINGRNLPRITDDDYTTAWRAGEDGKAYLDVAAPEGEAIGGLYIKWFQVAPAWRVTVKQDDGSWATVSSGRTGYLAEWLALPDGVTACRLRTGEKLSQAIDICELRVFSRGEPPAHVQRWQPAWDRCDLMVLVAHPDDELLYMGGSIPYYAGERGMRVQVCYAVPTSNERRLELLDGLWLCGVRAYPILGTMSDSYAMSLKGIYEKWSKDKLFQLVTRMIRQCKPDVLITHDLKGEYGHGAHRAVADAATQCVEPAANPRRYAKSSKEYGAWQVSKLYLHLYPQNAIVMDWREPLAAFGGRTAFDMACEGFLMHRSQQGKAYAVLDEGDYDNRLFGLYYSNVGADIEKNDFFENIPDTV